MRLKHLAALLVLFAVGCAEQPASETAAPGDGGGAAAAPAEQESASVEPETETQLASTTVKFDVTGMT